MPGLNSPLSEAIDWDEAQKKGASAEDIIRPDEYSKYGIKAFHLFPDKNGRGQWHKKPFQVENINWDKDKNRGVIINGRTYIEKAVDSVKSDQNTDADQWEEGFTKTQKEFEKTLRLKSRSEKSRYNDTKLKARTGLFLIRMVATVLKCVLPPSPSPSPPFILKFHIMARRTFDINASSFCRFLSIFQNFKNPPKFTQGSNKPNKQGLDLRLQATGDTWLESLLASSHYQNGSKQKRAQLSVGLKILQVTWYSIPLLLLETILMKLCCCRN